jgi:hypothetical protein
MPLRKNYVSANIVKRVIYMSTVNTKLTQDLMVVEFISLLSAKSLKKKSLHQLPIQVTAK